MDFIVLDLNRFDDNIIGHERPDKQSMDQGYNDIQMTRIDTDMAS